MLRGEQLQLSALRIIAKLTKTTAFPGGRQLPDSSRPALAYSPDAFLRHGRLPSAARIMSTVMLLGTRRGFQCDIPTVSRIPRDSKMSNSG